MSWPFHTNEDGSVTTYNPAWPLERRKAAQALSASQEPVTKPASLAKSGRFDTPEEKEAFIAALPAKTELVKPPIEPPAARRSVANDAPEPRKRSLDEILGHRARPLSRLDAILAGKSVDVVEKDAELTTEQRAAYDRVDALMSAGVTGDTLRNAVVAFAATFQGEQD